MLPTVLLDINPSETVLDMCASPGSKTIQIIEALNNNLPTTTPAIFSQGLCVASEMDEKRAAMLAHQTLLLNFPGLLILNEDSRTLPNELSFDKILCDVPCSGDGTTRKNGIILKNWSPKFAMKLHNTQRQLLLKGLQLLKPQGILVYSTCSMNPIENEAVVTSILKDCDQHLELLDIDKIWPLEQKPIWRKGLTTWKIFTRIKKQGMWYENYADVPKEYRSGIEETMFPNQYSYLLERTRRLYHHLNDTGGFFLACFAKKTPFYIEIIVKNHELKEEEKEEAKIESKKEDFCLKIENFVEIDENNLKMIRNFYSFNKDFPKERVLGVVTDTKGKSSPLPKRMVIVNEGILNLLKKFKGNPSFLKMNTISLGINAFKFIREAELEIKYRILIESLDFFLPYLEEKNARVIETSFPDFEALMVVKNAQKTDEIKNLTAFCVSSIKALSQGPFIVECKLKDTLVCLVFWKGISHINLLMKTQDINYLNFRLGFSKIKI